jgi:hypothetical protein
MLRWRVSASGQSRRHWRWKQPLLLRLLQRLSRLFGDLPLLLPGFQKLFEWSVDIVVIGGGSGIAVIDSVVLVL